MTNPTDVFKNVTLANTAIQRGYDEYLEGKPITANPYKKLGGFWEIGWLNAQIEASQTKSTQAAVTARTPAGTPRRRSEWPGEG